MFDFEGIILSDVMEDASGAVERWVVTTDQGILAY
tara:strand:+ start:433 stop:537 length:105 start_codon:yes stop_codon:yes gene_type:complete